MNEETVQEENPHEIVDNGDGQGIAFRFELHFLVPQQFHKKLKYAKGRIKSLLDGKTAIVVPSPGASEKVVIKGNSEKEIIETKQRLVKFIFNIQASQRLTHFLSVKFTTEEIKRNFIIFRDEIINDTKLEASLFQKPEKLHVTVVMLSLKNEEEKARARECLETCKEKILDPVLKDKPLTVSVSGVSVFSDERPSASHVLFGKVVSEELQDIANRTAKLFADQGLSKHTNEDVVLHLTMINTAFYKPFGQKPGQSNRGNSRYQKIRYGSFDARKILEKYKNFDFGSLSINKIEISEIGSMSEDGFYISIGSLQF